MHSRLCFIHLFPLEQIFCSNSCIWLIPLKSITLVACFRLILFVGSSLGDTTSLHDQALQANLAFCEGTILLLISVGREVKEWYCTSIQWWSNWVFSEEDPPKHLCHSHCSGGLMRKKGIAPVSRALEKVHKLQHILSITHLPSSGNTGDILSNNGAALVL